MGFEILQKIMQYPVLPPQYDPFYILSFRETA